MLGLQRVVGEFPFPHAEEDENDSANDEHGNHGSYMRRDEHRTFMLKGGLTIVVASLGTGGQGEGQEHQAPTKGQKQETEGVHLVEVLHGGPDERLLRLVGSLLSSLSDVR